MKNSIPRLGVIMFIFIIIQCSFCGLVTEYNPEKLIDNNDSARIEEFNTDSKMNIEQISSRGNEPVTFNNVSGLSNLLGLRSDSFAWGDYNNDGYLDFLARGNISTGTRLFKNNGPPAWNFTDITEVLNLSGSGPSPNRGYPIWGDYNNDNYLDFFVAGDHDQLWKNNGPPNWNFTNVTLIAGNLDDNRPSEAAAWGDYDRDGYLDIYVNSWRDAQNNKFPDVLWHNNGDGTFSDVSTQAGIYTSNTPAYDSPPFAGMGVAWGDYNNDGWPDIYVCNYLVAPNYLLRNNHDGTFTDIAVEQSVAGKADIYNNQGPYYGHTAGAGWGDFNNNGNLDLWTSNLAHKDSEQSGGSGRGYFCDDSMMFRNKGAPFFEFEDIRNRTGIPITPVGAIQDSQWKDEDYFGVTWGDYDNDRDLDLWVPQVKGYHSWAHSYLWQNNNDETFTDTSDNVGVKVWSNTGAAWGDYNNDGFIDLITEGTNPYQGKRETRLYKNNGNSNNWLQLRLKGALSNTAAIGARIILNDGEVIQTREIGGDAGGHAFQNAFMVEFGLGNDDKADEITIIWPSGIVQVLKNIPANQILNVTEETSGPKISSISVSNYDVDEDEVLTFNGVTTGTIASYEWDFNNDGIIDRETTSAPPLTQFNYSIAGNYTAKLWVWDANREFGWAETTDFIFVNNVAPIALAGEDVEVWEDEIIYFDGSHCVDTPSDLDTLKYNWTFDDGTYSGWNISALAQHSYAKHGLFDVELQIRDNDNEIDTDSIIVAVKNKPPTCQILANRTVAEDSEIIISVIGNDTISDFPTLIYRWDFGDGNGTYWIDETSIAHTYTQKGSYVISCSVRDDNGALDVGYSNTQITVYNMEPKCWVEGDKTVYEDEKVNLNGAGTDTKSDKITLRYFWDFADGTNSDWLYPDYQNVSHTYTKKGWYQPKLIVQDDDGARCTKVINITVNNLPPACSVMYSEIELDEDETVIFNGDGEDTTSDLEKLLYSWDFGVSGVPNSNWNASPEFEYVFKNEGEYTGTLTVMDDDGETATADIDIVVENIVPTARFLVSSESVEEDELVKFDARLSEDSASDIDNLIYTWDFDDGSNKQHGSIQKHMFYRDKTYKISLTVTDDNGISDSITQNIKVRNVPPTAVISASKKESTPGTLISFIAESTDTSSDTINLTYEWIFSDNDIATGEVVTYKFDKPGKYKVRLTITDDDASTAEDHISITIEESSKSSTTGIGANDQNVILISSVGILILFILLILLLLFFLKRTRSLESEKPSEEIDVLLESEPPEQVPAKQGLWEKSGSERFTGQMKYDYMSVIGSKTDQSQNYRRNTRLPEKPKVLAMHMKIGAQTLDGKVDSKMLTKQDEAPQLYKPTRPMLPSPRKNIKK